MVDGESEVQLGHTAPVYSAAFSPDGELVASGSYDGTVRFWDPRIALGVDLEGHQSSVAAVSFWAEDTHLLSVSSDRTVRLWDPESGAALETWPTPLDGIEDALVAPIKRIEDALLAPLARELAIVGHEGGVVWSVDTETTRLELEPFGGGLSAVWISPDASRLVVGAEDGRVRVLEGATGEVLHETEPLGTAIDDLLAAPNVEHVFVVEDDQLYTWDVETAVPERLFPEDTSDIATVIMSERGTRLAVSYRDGNLVILDAEGTELGRLAQQSARVNALAFNADATRLAVATADRSVRLWDVETREPLLILRRPPGTVLTLDFDAAGERLAAGYSSGRVHVWCTQPGNERHGARVQVERAQRMAQPVVRALFDELVEPALVVARLSSSSDLTADVEAAARSMARSIDGESQRLESECLAALRSPDEQPAVYERALWLARLCVLRAPDDERYLRLQGMALARLGRYEEALPLLERAQAERTRNRRARPEVLAFLALCQHHLGRAEDAAQTLVQLRALMQISTVMGTEHALEFMREVEALIAPGR